MKHAIVIDNRDLEASEEGRRDVVRVPFELSYQRQQRLAAECSTGEFVRRKRAAHARYRAGPKPPSDRYVTFVGRIQSRGRLLSVLREHSARGDQSHRRHRIVIANSPGPIEPNARAEIKREPQAVEPGPEVRAGCGHPDGH